MNFDLIFLPKNRDTFFVKDISLFEGESILNLIHLSYRNYRCRNNLIDKKFDKSNEMIVICLMYRHKKFQSAKIYVQGFAGSKNSLDEYTSFYTKKTRVGTDLLCKKKDKIYKINTTLIVINALLDLEDLTEDIDTIIFNYNYGFLEDCISTLKILSMLPANIKTIYYLDSGIVLRELESFDFDLPLHLTNFYSCDKTNKKFNVPFGCEYNLLDLCEIDIK